MNARAAHDANESETRSHVNLRGPIVIFSVVPLCIVFFQLFGEAAFQWGRGYRWLASEISLWLGLIGLIFWMGVRSGFSGRVRLVGSLMPLISLIAFFSIFAFKRDGDLIPYGVRLRWAKTVIDDAADVKPDKSIEIETDTASDERPSFDQFLGSNRDGIVRDVHLERDWTKHPPRELWRQPIGGGYSSFSIVKEYIFTQELRGEQECVSCYELLTGKTVWRRKTEDFFQSNWTGGGPRATPTIDGDRLYAVGGEGGLYCLEAATGEVVWSTQILKPYEAENTKFGKSCSPLILDKKVIVTGGGTNGPSLIAYEKETGDMVWKSSWGDKPDDQGTIYNSYASPVLVSLHGVPQILNMEDKGVASYEPETGEQLWTFDWPWEDVEPKVAQPVVVADNRIFVSAAYASGCAVFEVRRADDGMMATELVWDSRRLKTKFSNVVVHEGFVYGLHDRVLSCLDLRDGKKQWAGGRYGHGQILMVDDLILVVGEMGEVALVEATPSEHRELGRFQALNDRTWNSPAISIPGDNDAVAHLLLRNDQEAMCYGLARRATQQQDEVTKK